MEPTRRPLIERPGWNDQAAVALLVLVAGHLLAVEPTADPLTPDRLARVVGAYHDLQDVRRDGGQRLGRLWGQPQRPGAPRRHIPAKQQRVHRGALLVCDLSHL